MSAHRRRYLHPERVQMHPRYHPDVPVRGDVLQQPRMSEFPARHRDGSRQRQTNHGVLIEPLLRRDSGWKVHAQQGVGVGGRRGPLCDGVRHARGGERELEPVFLAMPHQRGDGVTGGGLGVVVTRVRRRRAWLAAEVTGGAPAAPPAVRGDALLRWDRAQGFEAVVARRAEVCERRVRHEGLRPVDDFPRREVP